MNFSNSYIRRERFFFRFILILLLFVICIYLLIFRGNLFFLILGWDGLGVSSFLLVVFFFSRKSYNAGLLTVIINRLGDVFLIIRIGILFFYKSWNLLVLRFDERIKLFRDVRLCLIFASFTKRAQIPFSAWLPAAMAAPTPVSSLVHSSTLVTAGVYLVYRLFRLLNISFIFIFGVLTLIIAGISAIWEIDIKKIVALSTLSQLGLIYCTLGAGLKESAFFHLLVHAFFKALLFIRVGNIIHLSDDYQDLRKVNFFSNNFSYTGCIALTANLSLVGAPFISGFYSKDLILEYFAFRVVRKIFFYIFYVGCLLTLSYTLRFIYLIFFLEKKSKSMIFKYYEDKEFVWGRRVLFFLSVRAGRFLSWILFSSPNVLIFPIFLKISFVFIIFIGFILFIFISQLKKNFFLIIWGGIIWGLPFFSGKLIKSSLKYIFFSWSFCLDYFYNKKLFLFIWNISENLRFFNYKKDGFFFYNFFIIILLIIFIIFI